MLCAMSGLTAGRVLAETAPGREGIHPLVNLIVTLGILIFMLFLVTRFNRDK